MSTSSTVDAEVVRSVRKTSKSSGRSRTGVPPRGRRAGAFSSRIRALRHRRPQVEVERVAELERLGRLLAVAAAAGPIEPVAAERVALRSRANRSSSTFCPIRRLPRGVSSIRSPSRSR